MALKRENTLSLRIGNANNAVLNLSHKHREVNIVPENVLNVLKKNKIRVIIKSVPENIMMRILRNVNNDTENITGKTLSLFGSKHGSIVKRITMKFVQETSNIKTGFDMAVNVTNLFSKMDLSVLIADTREFLLRLPHIMQLSIQRNMIRKNYFAVDVTRGFIA